MGEGENCHLNNDNNEVMIKSHYTHMHKNALSWYPQQTWVSKTKHPSSPTQCDNALGTIARSTTQCDNAVGTIARSTTQCNNAVGTIARSLSSLYLTKASERKACEYVVHSRKLWN